MCNYAIVDLTQLWLNVVFTQTFMQDAKLERRLASLAQKVRQLLQIFATLLRRLKNALARKSEALRRLLRP